MNATAPNQCTTNESFYRSSQSYWQSLENAANSTSGTKTAIENLPPPPDAQIVIIGAGFAGLTTAIEIRERSPETQVLILEKHHVGFGASGRNGGLMSPLPAPVYLMGSRYNAEHLWALSEFNNRVKQSAAWLKDTIGHTEVRTQSLSIQAMGPLTGAALPHIARDLDKIEIDCDLSPITNAHTHPALTLNAHTINPFKLTNDLASYALKLGVQICEGINVISINSTGTGAKITYNHNQKQKQNINDKTSALKPETSSIQSNTVVLCTNAYTGDIKSLERLRAKPIYNFMVATQKLDNHMLSALPDKQRFIVELNHAYAFYRLHDNRMIFGGIEKLNNKDAGEFDIPCGVFNQLGRQLKKSLPACSDLEIYQAWSGKYHQTSVDLPIIRRSKVNPSIVYNVGYGGTGVALTLSCARLAAAIALNVPCQSSADTKLLQMITGTKLPITATARFGMGCLYDLLRAPFQASTLN